MSVVYYDAFGTDPKNGYWWSPSKDNMMAWMQKRIRKKMDDRAVRHFKITDVTSGDLVGFARWDIPEGVAHFGDWVGAANFDANVTSLVNSEQEKAQRGADQELSTSAPVVESQAKYVGVDPPEG